MNENIQTQFLAATSTFMIGMGSVLNIAGNYFQYNFSSTPEEADRLALENDWAVVGQDIRAELERMKREKLGSKVL